MISRLLLVGIFSFIAVIQPVTGDQDEEKDIVELAGKNESLKTLVSALKSAGLVDILKLKGPFTLLAPSDEAFGKMPEGQLESLLKPENKRKLVSILKHHVITSHLKIEDIKAGKLRTIAGKNVTVTVDGAEIRFNQSQVIQAGIVASNGVIHIIDGVLIPES
jgi:uncharacterized surface protein with fasciclin (FAS1) repeats